MVRKDYYNFLSDDDERTFKKFLEAETGSWSMDVTETDVRTDSGSTYVLERGKENAETIIWLHGYGLNAMSGKNILAAFAREHRVICPDIMWQTGRSTPNYPINRKNVHESYAAWLLELLDHYRIDRATVIGLSFGACIAAGFARNHSDRLRNLVLVSPAGSFAPVKKTLLFDQLRTALFPNAKNIRAFLRHGYGANNEIEPFDVALMTMFMRHCRKRSPSLVPAAVFADAELAAIACPSLVIVGDEDPYVDARGICERASGTMPLSRAVLLRGAAHYPHMTHSDDLEKAVREFLARGR